MNKTMIISLIILAVLIAFIIIRIFISKKDNAKEEAIKFLNSLAEKFEVVIIRHLKDIDLKHLEDLTDVEKQIVDDTINELWTLVQDQLTTYATSEATRELLRVIIDKEFLTNFVMQFFQEDEKVQEVYTSEFNDALVYKMHEAEKFEEDTAKQNFEYQTEDLSKLPKAETLDPNKIYDYSSGVAKPIEKELNPEKDITEDELVYDTEDTSVEVVEDNDKVSEKLQKEIEKQD